MTLDEKTYDPVADSKEDRIWEGLIDLLEVAWEERTRNDDDLEKVVKATAALMTQKRAGEQLSRRSLGLLAIEGTRRQCAYVERVLQRNLLVARLVALAGQGGCCPARWHDRNELDGRKFSATTVWRVPTRLRYAEAAKSGLDFVGSDMHRRRWIKDDEFYARSAQAGRLYTRALVYLEWLDAGLEHEEFDQFVESEAEWSEGNDANTVDDAEYERVVEERRLQLTAEKREREAEAEAAAAEAERVKAEAEAARVEEAKAFGWKANYGRGVSKAEGERRRLKAMDDATIARLSAMAAKDGPGPPQTVALVPRDPVMTETPVGREPVELREQVVRGPGGAPLMHVAIGGKKSRRKKTKRRHKTGGKKSRKQRKRATIKGGKRKRRRTRRRR